MSETGNVTSSYQFILKSSFPFLNLEQYKSSKVFDRIVIADDIYEFYPSLEVHVNDKTGIIVDGIVSAEGHLFTSKLGSDQAGYTGWLESSWVWRNHNTTDIPITHYIGGVTSILFSHSFYRSDIPRSRAWDDTISNIVKSIVTEDYGISSNKVFVTNTTGKQIRQQGGIKNWDYLKSLANISHSIDYEYSPFITFINSAGEFYFKTIDDLLRTGEKISQTPYIIESDVDSITKQNVLSKIIAIRTLGLGSNKNNYAIDLTKYNVDFEKETTNILDFLLGSDPSKNALINSDLKKDYPVFSSSKYGMGLYDIDRDVNDYKGHRNAIYKQNVFNLRMDIVIPFNPKAITGKIIVLDIGSVIEYKAKKSKELSGSWLILSSRVFMDVDGIPYSELEIGKNSVDLDNQHPLKGRLQ